MPTSSGTTSPGDNEKCKNCGKRYADHVPDGDGDRTYCHSGLDPTFTFERHGPTPNGVSASPLTEKFLAAADLEAEVGLGQLGGVNVDAAVPETATIVCERYIPHAAVCQRCGKTFTEGHYSHGADDHGPAKMPYRCLVDGEKAVFVRHWRSGYYLRYLIAQRPIKLAPPPADQPLTRQEAARLIRHLFYRVVYSSSFKEGALPLVLDDFLSTRLNAQREPKFIGDDGKSG